MSPSKRANWLAKKQAEQEAAAKEAAQKAFEARKTATHIDGHYIPADLHDAMQALDRILDPEARKALQENDPTRMEARALGMSLRNTWGLWTQSRLWHYFAQRGQRWPDDIAAIIVETYQLWVKGNADAPGEWEKTNPVIGNPKAEP